MIFQIQKFLRKYIDARKICVTHAWKYTQGLKTYACTFPMIYPFLSTYLRSYYKFSPLPEISSSRWCIKLHKLAKIKQEFDVKVFVVVVVWCLPIKSMAIVEITFVFVNLSSGIDIFKLIHYFLFYIKVAVWFNWILIILY